MRRLITVLCLFFIALLPVFSLAHTDDEITVSKIERKVVPAPVVKKYEPEKSSTSITTLKIGVKDSSVSLLQGFLTNYGYYSGPIDGFFGQQTENALKSFQKDSFGVLSVDGVAGPKTLKYIENLPQVKSNYSLNNAQNTNTSTVTQTQTKKTQIPSLPNKVLSKALTAPSLTPISDTDLVSVANKNTSKPKIITKSGFSNAGIFITASNFSTQNNQSNLNTNFSSGQSQVTGKYVCGTKDGVRNCFVVSLDEASQIESGVLDVDQVLLAKTGGTTQSGNCPSFFVDESGNPGVTDQSWWNQNGCPQPGHGDGATTATVSSGKVCLNGITYNETTGVSLNQPCEGGITLNSSLSSADPGINACAQGVNFNPITGARCGAKPKNAPKRIDTAPLFCETGARFDPFSGIACASNSKIEPGSVHDSLAAYVANTLKPIEKGEKSRNVDVIQRVFANYGILDPKYQTGFSGEITESATKDFQRKIGITETGKVDNQTLSFIKAALVTDTAFKNVNKSEKVVSKNESGAKLLNLLNKFPTGLDISKGGQGQTQTNSSSVNTNIQNTTFNQTSFMNPVNGGAGSPGDVGQVYCKRITSSAVAPNIYTVRVYIGTDKLFWVEDSSPVVNYQKPGEAGPFPASKIIAGSGKNGLYFTYIPKSGDNFASSAFPSLFHAENKNITLEIVGSSKIHTLSKDGTKYYSFDWSKLNDPNLPTCTLPSWGNGFIGVIGPDGTVGGVTGPVTGGNNNGGTSGGGTSNPPSCFDGIQNQNETGVDVGGVCGGTSGGGTSNPPSCFDGIQNQDETSIDTGGVCGTGTNGGIITGGPVSNVDDDGNPCPTSAPCHDWHGHRWGGPFPLQFTVEDRLQSQKFKNALTRAVNNFNLSDRLNYNVVQSSNNGGNCMGSGKTIPVCDGFYGNVGWMGVATMASDNTGRIVAAGVQLNRTYLDSGNYATVAWANLVTCQELLHTAGILHNDVDFGSKVWTCMDYHTTSTNSEDPNARDMYLLELMYPASGNSNKQGVSQFSNFSNTNYTALNNAMKNIQVAKRATLGVPAAASNGVISHYEKQLEIEGQQYSIHTHFFPIPPQ